MQPTYISVASLFGTQTRHTVPLFQRPYVWGPEEQWDPLWQDLLGLLARVLEKRDGAPVAGHFLGTIVLDQAPNNTGSLPRREVIDGQQRLTTLQVLLKAAEHALRTAVGAVEDEGERQRIDIAARQIAFLTENPAFSAPEEKYKVWPTNEDRPAFQAVMDSSAESGVGAQTTRMADAYRFFRQKFLEWLPRGKLADRAQAFADALKDHLRLIVLDLDKTDEPQAIFETLNAHGTPLLPADLMKNWLLWEATRQKLLIAPLYEDYWRPFDRDHLYWRERVGVGHAARARVDTFLQNWLTRRTVEPVSAKHLYDRFLSFAGELRTAQGETIDVAELMDDIRSDALRYEQIDRPSGNSRFATFLRRLKTLDVIVFHPVLLALMGRAGSDQSDVDRVAVHLESYLVRRMVCGYQTRGYGALAIALLQAVKSVPNAEAVAPIVSDTLATSTSGSEDWPSDETFRREWLRRKFYGGLRRDRVLMILQAIEEECQRKAELGEPLLSFDFSKLQIEHIMPQSWREHWTLSDGKTGDDRDFAVHGIGNLTLVSGRLNPTLSNAPWLSTESSSNCKRAALEVHSNLQLNKLLVRDFADRWDEDSMVSRASALFNVARAIWPAPPEGARGETA